MNELIILNDLIDQNRDEFSDKFVEWLPINLHIWNAFCVEATKVYKKGFKHYSSQTIIYVLRHHSNLYENGSNWKLNNDITPYLSRLFDLRYPEMSGLWEFRIAYRAKKDAMERKNNGF